MLLFYLSLLDTQEEKSKFEKIYEKYRLLMLYIARDILEDNYLAEDAVHEAFLKIIKFFDKIEEISCHKTHSFIVIVIRSTAIDMLRKKNKYQTVSIDDIPESEIAVYDMPDDLSVDEIVDKLEQLPDIHRDILELKVYHELSDKEIADVLKISYSAARKRIERARTALERLLNE